MLLSMRVRSGHETEGEGGGPAGGWGSIRAVAGDPSRSRDPRQRNPAEAEQAGRLHVREMLLGEAGKAAPLRVLRERGEGNGMEITNKLVAPVFFAEHTHTGSDHQLEERRPALLGRKTLKSSERCSLSPIVLA
jgi:hypothetical protein